jgi:calcyclin binding protein
MVEISPIEESTPPIASKERFMDADEIESLLHQVKRPSVKAHLEALAIKIRKDGQALERVEASQAKVETKEGKESNPTVESPTTRVPKINTAPISIGSNLKYKSIDRFSFDLGSYNSSHITIYIPMQDIGQHSKEKIHCKFTKESFDLTIDEFEGVNHRLVKDNLDKNIDPTTSKMIIKANKIIIKLGKVKNEYGYESWTDLTSKKSKETKKQMEKDPQASIMNLMKEMYDSGDDNMKKMIGETMLKQREGKLDKPDLGSMDDAF